MNESWLALHAAYLASPEWKLRGAAVLARDQGWCTAHLRTCTNRAEEVHHLTYRHWRNEPLFDLVSVCAGCHEELTRMDRQNQAHAPHGRLSASERAELLRAPTRRLERMSEEELTAEHERRLVSERDAVRESA